MIVVNLYGVPSSGKSTAAAYIFYKLKEAGVNAELVTEVAKDLVYENNTKAINNQLYIAGNQYYRLSKIDDSVDVAITDSPLLLQPVYYRFNGGTHCDCFEILIYAINKQYDNLNYILPLPKEVESVGRIHDLEDGKVIYGYIDEMFLKYGVEHSQIERDIHSYNEIVADVIDKLRAKGETKKWQ